MIRRATKKDLRGRRIVDVNLNRFRDGRGGWAYAPAILLDNGVLLTFEVQETDVADYGVAPVLAIPERSGKETQGRVSTQETQEERDTDEC